MSEKWERTTLSPSISSVGGSPVKTYPLQEEAPELTENDPVCGQNSRASLASWCPVTRSWRTRQRSIVGGWVEFSETWPRSGTMQSGTVYPLQPSAPLTDETAFLLLPTPTANEGGRNKSASSGAKIRPSLGMMAKHNLWPDLSQIDPSIVKPGPLAPEFVEWLQGFPIGWTDCDV